MLLSQYSPVRRQEVFSLSQPGNYKKTFHVDPFSFLKNVSQMLLEAI